MIASVLSCWGCMAALFCDLQLPHLASMETWPLLWQTAPLVPTRKHMPEPKPLLRAVCRAEQACGSQQRTSRSPSLTCMASCVHKRMSVAAQSHAVSNTLYCLTFPTSHYWEHVVFNNLHSLMLPASAGHQCFLHLDKVLLMAPAGCPLKKDILTARDSYSVQLCTALTSVNCC